jgi:GNAT superfamily N-acetyltransferase
MNEPTQAALTIGQLAPAEIEVADRLLIAAYGMASRRAELERYLALQPDGWILARWDGQPAGAAGATVYGPTAYIGLVGVDPAFQRRGIALAMMQHLLTWLAVRGDPIVLLDASVKGAPLYEQLGFVDDERSVVYMQDDCARLPPEPARVSTLAAGDLPAVAAFDAPIFGAERAAVFKRLRAEAPDRALLARDEAGYVSGYLFAQPTMLGPWAARTPADAEALLGAALRLSFASGPGALVPSSNPDAAALLMRYGFSPQRSLRHMRLGGSGPVGVRERLYGLASFAIG